MNKIKMILTLRLNEVDPCDMDVWRSNVRFAMCAATQLPGEEPTGIDDAPAPAFNLMLIMNYDYDDDDDRPSRMMIKKITFSLN